MSEKQPLLIPSFLIVSGALLQAACSSSTPSDDDSYDPTISSGGMQNAAGVGGASGGVTSTMLPSGGSDGSGGDASGAGGDAAVSTGGAAAGGAPLGAVGGSESNAGGSDGAGGDSAAGGGDGSGGTEANAGGSGSGGSSAEPCPSDASFCSGFEDTELPAGAVFRLNGDPATPWTGYFEVDTAVKSSGSSSLRVKTITEASGAYKILAVPSGGSAFWVRMYMRSDVDLGADDHNVFALAAGSDDPNDGNSVEFAEDVGLAFNSQDDVRWPEGYGRIDSGTMPYTLAKDTWYCIELSFDGSAGQQGLYIDGVEVINAPNFPAAAMNFSTFKFGYNALHGTVRQIWYDDLAVAPSRIGCL